MVTRILSAVVVVSTLLVLNSSFAAAQVPHLPKGSKVFIASMDGLDAHMQKATSAVDFPLVFVRTRAEADYELTGTTREVRPEKAGFNNVRTTRQSTTMAVTNIASGERVFAHTVQTEIRSPEQHGSQRSTESRTASSILDDGRAAAARQSAAALREAVNAAR